MYSDLEELLTTLNEAIQDSVDVLDAAEAEDFDETLEALSTVLLNGAVRLHSCRQSHEEAVSGLLAYIFEEIAAAVPGSVLQHLQESVRVHSPAAITSGGVSACQDFEFRCSVSPARPR